MIYKPTSNQLRWEGLLFCLWLVLIDLLLLLWAWQRDTDIVRLMLVLLVVLSVPVLLMAGYRTWMAFTLEYWIDRNAVTINWGNRQQIIPLNKIERIIEGGFEDLSQARWYHWPMPYMRSARTLGLSNLQLFATTSLAESLIFDTGEAVFAISPQKPEQFLEIVQQRYRLGSVAPGHVRQVQTEGENPIFGYGFAGAVLLGVGFMGVLALFGLLMMRFPDLPEMLPFHYNSEGIPDLERSKSALFILPAVGLLAWLINGLGGMWMVARKEWLGAYMLWGGSIIIQICSLLALSSLMRI